MRLKSRPRSLAGASRGAAWRSRLDRTCRIKIAPRPTLADRSRLWEKQFINVQITSMLVQAGFDQIRFSDLPPYGCAVAIKTA